MDLFDKNIIKNFIYEPVLFIQPITDGHINKTFLVVGDKRYILQAMNKDLYSDKLDVMKYNYRNYRDAIRRSDEPGVWEKPVWIKTRDEKYFYQGDDGNIWRMYRYIENEGYNESKTGPEVVGEGLGHMHSILKGCKYIKPVHPNLFDLDYYYRRYINIFSIKAERDTKLDSIIAKSIGHMTSIETYDERFIHGDAKVSNMIFAGGKVTGFIDMDTIMPGSIFWDIADCLRSCCSDENKMLLLDKLNLFLEGYEESSKTIFSNETVGKLVEIYYRNRFMLGLRYYTDYLNGNVYFNENYKGQNLEKARKLLIQ